MEKNKKLEERMKEIVIKKYGLRKKNGCFDINKALKVEKELVKLLEGHPVPVMENLDLYHLRLLLK